MTASTERRIEDALDAAFEQSAIHDERRQAAIRLGASPTRCQCCEHTDGREVAWSDASSVFLCGECYEGQST